FRASLSEIIGILLFKKIGIGRHTHCKPRFCITGLYQMGILWIKTQKPTDIRLQYQWVKCLW
ncbi:MAG: hypothetical protein KKI01_12950, partial [Proteobacteria bacterium]|nr:hypothetical protein [Pseudomonadota bacterium]